MEEHTLYVVMIQKFDLQTMSRGPWEQASDPMPAREAAFAVELHWTHARPARRVPVSGSALPPARGEVVPFARRG